MWAFMPVFSLFVHLLKKKSLDEVNETLPKEKSWCGDNLFYLKIKCICAPCPLPTFHTAECSPWEKF